MLRWLLNLFRSERSGRVRLMTPPELIHRDGFSRDYKRYHRFYYEKDLTPYVNDRKVKFWKLVYTSDSGWFDQYVPFFYRKRRFGHKRFRN